MTKQYRRILLATLLVLLPAVLLADIPTGVTKIFTVQSSPGYTTNLDVYLVYPGISPKYHTVELRVTGTPASCTYALEGSALTLYDNPATTDFGNLSGDIDCTSVTLLHIANKPVNTVHGHLKALTGGTSPTVQLVYLGVR